MQNVAKPFRCALFGSPIAHSLSPLIHNCFAEQCSFSLEYALIETFPGNLKAAVSEFRQAQGVGANITLPLKEEAFSLCDKVTDRAKHAQAVNTLFWEKDVLWGDNTDGAGLVEFLTKTQGVILQGKRVLMLGAGGAARGSIWPLLEQGVSALAVVNRNIDRATALATEKNTTAYSFESFAASKEAPFDIVINATSASLDNTLLPLDPHWVKETTVLDMAYGKQHDTVFTQWAKEHGASSTFDGKGMLLTQAAFCFERWFKKMPSTDPLYSLFD